VAVFIYIFLEKKTVSYRFLQKKYRGAMSITIGNQSKYRERYTEHEFLSENILGDDKEVEFFKNIRLRLKEVRKELGITQREFGESSGIDRRYVAKVECGSQNPSFKFIRSVSIRHKISIDWLLYGVGEKFIITDENSYGKELVTFKKLLDKGSPEDIDVIIKMINKMLN
jgi:transcriptional regulator with XRE-family HTH domain